MVVPYQLACAGRRGGQLAAVTVADPGRRGAEAGGGRAAAVLRPRHESGPDRASGASTSTATTSRSTPPTCATSAPGIFAIGDIATYPGKLKLILSGFSEAAVAAHAIYPLLHPGEALHFEYSTTKGVPGS